MQIRILAFLCLSQMLISCQQQQEISKTVATANVDFSVLSSPETSSTTPAEGIIYQSLDGGQTWQDISAGLPGKTFVRGAYANESQLFVTTESGLYHTGLLPQSLSWSKEYMLTEKMTQITPGKSGIYASDYQNGIFQMTNGTGLWKPLHENLNDLVRSVFESSNGVLFAACEGGIYKSADEGNSWKKVLSDGMIMDIVEKDGIIIAGGFKGLFRSTDGGENWSTVLTEDGMALQTAVLGGRIVAITSGPSKYDRYDPKSIKNRIRISSDNGQTWQRADEHLITEGSIFGIAQVGEYLVCSNAEGILRSNDNGKTWELIMAADEKIKYRISGSGKVLFAISGAGGC